MEEETEDDSCSASRKVKSQQSASTRSDTTNLKEEFQFYITQAKKKALNLENFEDKGRACAWIKSLSEAPLDQDILDYAKFLLWAVHCCKLLGPFANLPPAKIEPLPPGVAAKAFNLDATDLVKELMSESGRDDSSENGSTNECVPEKANGYYEFTVKAPASVNLSLLKEDCDSCTYKLPLTDDMNKCPTKTQPFKKENICPAKKSEQTNKNTLNDCSCMRNQHDCNQCAVFNGDQECLKNIICSRVIEALSKVGQISNDGQKKCQPERPKSANANCSAVVSTPSRHNCASPIDIAQLINTVGLLRPGYSAIEEQQSCIEGEERSCDECASEQIDFDQFTTEQYQRMMASERRKFWQPYGVDPRMLGLRGLYDTPCEQRQRQSSPQGQQCLVVEPDQTINYPSPPRSAGRVSHSPCVMSPSLNARQGPLVRQPCQAQSTRQFITPGGTYPVKSPCARHQYAQTPRTLQRMNARKQSIFNQAQGRVIGSGIPERVLSGQCTQQRPRRLTSQDQPPAYGPGIYIPRQPSQAVYRQKVDQESPLEWNGRQKLQNMMECEWHSSDEESILEYPSNTPTKNCPGDDFYNI